MDFIIKRVSTEITVSDKFDKDDDLEVTIDNDYDANEFSCWLYREEVEELIKHLQKTLTKR